MLHLFTGRDTSFIIRLHYRGSSDWPSHRKIRKALTLAILRRSEREKRKDCLLPSAARKGVRRICLKEELPLALDATQKEKLAALLAQEHVAVLVTQGENWPTANLQAFAETPEFDLLFIMGGNATSIRTCSSIPRRP
jgi:hypothetical protein